jgi:hypothetical protein
MYGSSGTPGTWNLVTEWMEARRTRPAHEPYYYSRVRQVDGDYAWSSPIQGDLARPANPADGGRSFGRPRRLEPRPSSKEAGRNAAPSGLAPYCAAISGRRASASPRR